MVSTVTKYGVTGVLLIVLGIFFKFLNGPTILNSLMIIIGVAEIIYAAYLNFK